VKIFWLDFTVTMASLLTQPPNTSFDASCIVSGAPNPEQ
jgi:hypothetical protein